MGNNVYVINVGSKKEEDNVIDIDALKSNKKIMGLISSAREKNKDFVVEDHTSEPIKNLEDIYRITEFLKAHGRYRDNMLFIVGINFGLRVSDLRELRFSNLITDNFMFRDTFPVFEKKTRNTRKKKINRYITINEAVIEAVTLYLEHNDNVSLSDYMFRSESNRGVNVNKPLDTRSINRILKGIARDLDLNVKMSTHTLRKTFCYHQMVMSNNDTRKLLLLQKMLNHSTPAQTLEYIGITNDEIYEAYKNLNLGGNNNYSGIMAADIVEEADGGVVEYGLS